MVQAWLGVVVAQGLGLFMSLGFRVHGALGFQKQMSMVKVWWF